MTIKKKHIFNFLFMIAEVVVPTLIIYFFFELFILNNRSMFGEILFFYLIINGFALTTTVAIGFINGRILKKKSFLLHSIISAFIYWVVFAFLTIALTSFLDYKFIFPVLTIVLPILGIVIGFNIRLHKQ